MREIKFRFGWHTLKDIRDFNGLREWVFGIHTLDELIGNIGGGELFSCYKTRDEYTGLNDKNGKEIYEGDIVTDGEFTGEVYYHDYLGYSDRPGEMAYVVGNRTKPAAYRHLGRGHAGDWEILGNIYENPELLKGEV